VSSDDALLYGTAGRGAFRVFVAARDVETRRGLYERCEAAP
jgi:hypothetical protein